MKLIIDKQFKNPYPIEERIKGKYNKNWILRRKNFLLLRGAYEIEPEIMARVFTMTIDDIALTLFDAHFAVNHTDRITIDHLRTQRYN